MIWSILGIILGIILGMTVNVSIPQELTRYTAVIILGMLDSLFGAIRSETAQNNYNSILFISGLLFSIIFAVLITYLGEHLGLNLYLAVTVVFTFRIFKNVGIVRREWIETWLLKKNASQESSKKL